jgi:hypothetical protein
MTRLRTLQLALLTTTMHSAQGHPLREQALGSDKS